MQRLVEAWAALRSVILAAAVSITGATAAYSFTVRDDGGVLLGAAVLHVTTLADDGPGSLRSVAGVAGPRVIVFDVAGYIELKSDIDIRSGNVTVAGQTAPSPGVVIRGASIRIRASDVVVQHLGVYPGPSGDPKIDGERDAVTLISSATRKMPVHNVVLRNVSLGWATDENLGIAGNDTAGVLIDRAIIAKGLRRTNHPKKIHSMGVLIGPDIKKIGIVNSVFAFNNRRNPHISHGSQLYFAGNVVYNFGERLIEFYRGIGNIPTRTTIKANIFIPGPDTQCDVKPVLFERGFWDLSPDAQIIYDGNTWDMTGVNSDCYRYISSSPLTTLRATKEPLNFPYWTALNIEENGASILERAGMRPLDRPPIDAAIVRQIGDRTGKIIDDPNQDGGWLPIAPTARVATIPIDRIVSTADLNVMKNFLCRTHIEVGGGLYPGCK